LQETTDLGNDAWVDSEVEFTESPDTSGNAMTTAKPAPQAPAKFYRLVFRP
jgi:hypothetical protein